MIRARRWGFGVRKAQNEAFALAAATLKARRGLEDLQRRLDALNEAIAEAESGGAVVWGKRGAAGTIEDGGRTDR